MVFPPFVVIVLHSFADLRASTSFSFKVPKNTPQMMRIFWGLPVVAYICHPLLHDFSRHTTHWGKGALVSVSLSCLLLLLHLLCFLFISQQVTTSVNSHFCMQYEQLNKMILHYAILSADLLSSIFEHDDSCTKYFYFLSNLLMSMLVRWLFRANNYSWNLPDWCRANTHSLFTHL